MLTGKQKVLVNKVEISYKVHNVSIEANVSNTNKKPKIKWFKFLTNLFTQKTQFWNEGTKWVLYRIISKGSSGLYS